MFRPLIGQTSDKQILFTWGLALTLENIALAIWKADPRMFFNPLRYTGIQIGGVMINYAMLLSFSVAVVLTVAIFLFLHKTDRGRLLRAAITNRDLVKFLGVNPDSVFLQGTMFSFVLAAVGGFLLALYYPVFPSVGQHYLFIMFVAIVLGGSGKIEGALVGGLLVGLIQEISATYLPTNFELLVVFIIFIIALNFRPRGLLGGR
jgi:branched-chain amino acid transport system permease protein